MLKNYLTIALRNFRHNKIFTIINVLGLSIGISSALVIFLIVHYDFSFDKFEKDGNRVYRVVTDMKFAGTPYHNRGVPAPLPEAVKKEVPGVEEVIGFHQPNGDLKVSIAKPGENKPAVFKDQSGIIYADKNYFSLIPFQWLAGSPKTALDGPYKVVLTEQRAKTYFSGIPAADMLGKQVVYDDSVIATVTGIVKDLDHNTDFSFKEFISQSTIVSAGIKDHYGWEMWGSINSGSALFLKLDAGTPAKAVESRLLGLLKKYSKSGNPDERNTTVFHLQPLNDLHFNAVYGTFGERTANKPTLYGLLIVAAFLLLLGCINFINLTTAQASQRAKEIGIRKTMGSSRKLLILQFLNETFLISLAATLISILITPLLLTVFADFIPRDLHFDLLNQPYLILFLLLLVIGVSIFSGFYPALVLSGYKPVQVLKNQVHPSGASSRKALLRKSLTVSQFFIAQVLVMATLITVKQIHFMLNKDMGFKKAAIITFVSPINWNNFSHPDPKRLVLLNELKSIPGIQMLSLASAPPSASGTTSSTMTYTDGKKEVTADVVHKSGDPDYIRLYQIKLLAGRNIEPSDTTKEYLVNETYMHILGIQNPADILNKRINGLPVVGVMADFNQESLHKPVKPMVFSADTRFTFIFNIALKPQDAQGILWSTTIGRIEKAYKNIYPEDDFQYAIFDQSIAKFYKSEEDISRLLKWAAGLAIFISCIGLLGLVIYTTRLRTREIGIRKVLGASVSHLLGILSRDFIGLVLIAFLIATPLAWLVMHKWLENFAYRTSISWWLFIASGGIMMLIALVTLSIQTIKTANANPVESLRTE